MSVDTHHADYDAMRTKWQRMRDVIAGQDAVHKQGETYLPRLKDQTDEDYSAYKLRATWFGATSRTIDALHGLMFRKAPVIEAPEGMANILADVTMSGRSAVGFTQDLGREILEVGRVGLLVDFPRVAERPSSLGAAVQSGLRPFATLYKAEQVINWRVQRIANRMLLTLAVLLETHEEWTDAFTVETVEQYRVLMLRGPNAEEAANGDAAGLRYVQEVYRAGEKGLDLVETTTPMIAGRPMAEIPFLIVGPEQVAADVSDPPMIDMADLNLSHYRTTADLEHGAHYTGLPMLFLAGVTLNDGEKVYLGSQTAITSSDPQADGKFIEFTGQGLGALETLLARKEAQMAALGASMLAAQKKGVEAADTHEMRTAQETSALADIASQLSQAMTQALQWLRDWSGASGDVAAQVSTDYVVTRMTAQDLTALLSAWQSGGISRETLFWNLQQGELVAEGKTVEDERAEIEAEGPVGMAPAGAGGAAGTV